MTKIANILIVVGMVLGVFLGLAVTIYLFSRGIDYVRDGQVFQGLLFALVWSELGGIAAGLSLILPASLCLSWLQRQRAAGG